MLINIVCQSYFLIRRFDVAAAVSRMCYLTCLFLQFDGIIEPALNGVAIGALDGTTVLYLMNTALILRYLDSTVT